MKERGKKEVAESGGRGILTQGRDGSPSGPIFAWKGGTGVSPVYGGKRGNLIERLGALPQHTAGTAMPHSQTTGAAPAYAPRDSGLASRREIGTPAARHPYPFISKGAAAPLVRSAFSIVSEGRDGMPSGLTFCRGHLSQPFLWCLLMAGFLFCVSLTGCERPQPPGPPPPVAQTPSPTPKIELGEPPRMP